MTELSEEAMTVIRDVGRELAREVSEAVRAHLAAPAPGLLPPEELASALRVSRKTVAKLARDGLPARRVGGLVRYDLDEVKDWLKARLPAEKVVEDLPPRRLGRGRR